MMESVDVTGQEEYIWAMRSMVREVSDYDFWLATPHDPACGVFLNQQKHEVMTRRSQKSMIRTVSETHDLDAEAQVLGSLVPDEIIYDCSNFDQRRYHACILHGNILGFSELCEKYNRSGKGGPSRLTPILNSYIGSIVQEILAYGADILHLSGESFLVMFKATIASQMQDCVHLAVDCGLTIQKSHGLFETEIGVNIRLKVSIAAGPILFSVIGFPELCNYVVVGAALSDLKNCERHANYGEIMVSQSAWEHINPTEYHVEYYDAGRLIKVLGLGLNWRSPIRSGKTERVIQEDEDRESKNSLEEIEVDDMTIRASLGDAMKMQIKDELRKFILKVIIRTIDMVEPLEYLTEMRQLVVLNINVVTLELSMDEMLSLVNKAYRIVLSVSDAIEGACTKVSMYDKDLMFVVAFGFRGFKHENECQLALRCAAECYRRLCKLADVVSISIGVTTGMTYCGIVGHALRREFAMLGTTVSKSYRLMNAYQGKVTCDRDTFLHSKMEAKNFILQEHKSFADIANTGPIYEFNETVEARGMARIMTKFPLLGRDEEMDIYLRILRGVMRESGFFIRHKRSSTTNIMKTVLHITADAKQGKSRLMDEFICITPESVPVSRYNFTPSNAFDPYYTIRQIFSLPLNIEEHSTLDDRTIRLRSRLTAMLVPELMCVLNPVFHVDFPKSELFLSLTKREKSIALTKMIKQLCYGSFPQVWSIMIENGEYIDKESWKLLAAMSETTLLYLTITTCVISPTNDNERNEYKKYLIENPRVYHLHLKPLDKWYHVGFACQILGVCAIPPELEKIIQAKSNGNAGWIESFLISLLQGGSLYIEQVEKSTIDDLGLVTPPIDMLMKLSKKDLSKLTAEHGYGTDTNMKGWRMYVTAFRDSHEALNKTTQGLSSSENVPVCFITPGANIGDVDDELTAEVFLMKIYDSLTSFEQKLLKCSAVIGYIFHRKMLEYVMNTKDILSTAFAIKKLFDIHVMCCSRGDFSQGDTFALSQKRSFFNMTYQSSGKIDCDCIGIRKPEELEINLPKYALCGLLRFKDPAFRDIMYTLLTDQQKKEFHGRALQFLEVETRKCRSCGRGVFTNILGKKHTHNDEFNRVRFLKKNRRAKMARLEDHTAALVMRRDSEAFQETVGSQHEHRKSTTSQARRETYSSVTSDIVTRATIELHYESQEYLIPKFVGMDMVKSNRFRPTLLKAFSNCDFTICECPEILDTMYKQMVDHCNGAGMKDKLVVVMLEYGHLCITTHNVPQALQILNKALDQLNATEESAALKNWRIPITRAEVCTLKGYAVYQGGQYEEAAKIFYKAMVNFGYPFPTNTNRIKFKSRLLFIRLASALLCCNRRFIHSKVGGEAAFFDNMSTCLSLMSSNFMILKLWKHAELAALWSLYNALSADQDFPTICDAYANLIRVMNHFNKDKICVVLEVHALCMCHRKRTNVERNDLASVVGLYASIFRARFQRAEVHRAIEVGFIILRICNTICDKETVLKMYPLLVQALILECRVDEAVYLLNDMEGKVEDDLDYSGKIWYFSLAIAVHLETGYSLVSYKDCEQFMNIEGEHVNTNRDPDSKRRYFTVMWLWCIRIRDYEAANTWQVKAFDTIILQENDTLENLFTALYHLEGLLLYMSDKSDRKNLINVGSCYSATDHIIQMLQKASKTATVIEARLYHLKAFYRNIRYDDKRTFSILKVAREIAVKRGNLLEQLWTAHSDMAWNHEMNNIKRHFWREHTGVADAVDYHEFDHDNCNMNLFTLEPPLYI